MSNTTLPHLVGFDGDDTLWRSQDFFEQAQADYEAILARYVDLADATLRERLYAVEKRNIAVFGYGVKGMALSMIEAAVDLTHGAIDGRDVHRIVELAKSMLRHPVELLPGMREAVVEVAAKCPVVLITKGDLAHQEAKVHESGLANLFRSVEIVSEKDEATYARLLRRFDVEARGFVMVGNSLKSDVLPVLALGGWGVHVPYHLTWVHEHEALPADATRFREVEEPAHLAAAIAGIGRSMARAPTAPERNRAPPAGL